MMSLSWASDPRVSVNSVLGPLQSVARRRSETYAFPRVQRILVSIALTVGAMVRLTR